MFHCPDSIDIAEDDERACCTKRKRLLLVVRWIRQVLQDYLLAKFITKCFRAKGEPRLLQPDVNDYRALLIGICWIGDKLRIILDHRGFTQLPLGGVGHFFSMLQSDDTQVRAMQEISDVILQLTCLGQYQR